MSWYVIVCNLPLLQEAVEAVAEAPQAAEPQNLEEVKALMPELQPLQPQPQEI